jgi:curved DNA-binding protein CbpA
LKKFYIKGYNNKFTGDDLEDENSEDLTYDLFSNDENNIYCELYKRINKFYYIRKNLDLVSGYAKELKNFEFPFNLVELISIKNDLIKNNFQKYKQILISIEKQIYRMGYESLFPNSSTNLSSFFSSNQKKKNYFEL